MKRITVIIICIVQILTVCSCTKKQEPTLPMIPTVQVAEDGVCYSSENFTVTRKMFSYLFYSIFYEDIAANGMYHSYIGFDPKLPLKEQIYSESTGESWFDYYIMLVTSSVNSYICYAEQALSEGFDPADIKDSVNEQMAAFELDAENEGMSPDEYYSYMFGQGVDSEAVRAGVELILTADTYNNKLIRNINAGVSEEQCNTEYESDPKSYQTVDLLYIITDDKALCEQLKDKSEEEFRALAEAKGVAVWEQEDVAYASEDELLEWAFADERRAADIFISETDEGSQAVYYLLEPPSRDERETKSFCCIYLSSNTYGSYENARKKAEEVLGEWQAGSKSVESFEELARIYSESTGYTYENILPQSVNDIFDRWIYDPYRGVGDADIIKTDSGCYVILCTGNGPLVWYKKVMDKISGEKLNEQSKKIFEVQGELLSEYIEECRSISDSVGAELYSKLIEG